MYLLLLWIAKLIQILSRLIGNSGAAAPGLFIEKVWPGFLEKGLLKMRDGVIVISGTNGKTTTTKVVSDVLKGLGEEVLTNTTGSNMTRGLLSLIVSKSSVTGSLPYGVAVLEVDEAYAAVLARRVPIRAAILLNVMRDQLDRFGEIDSTAEHLGVLSKAASEVVVLNADDSRIKKLPVNSKTVYFSTDNSLRDRLVGEDEWHSKAAKKSSHPSYARLVKSDQTQMEIVSEGKRLPMHTHFNGIHNHLNITAAYTLLRAIRPNVDSTDLVSQLELASPAFGRGETMSTAAGHITLLLIKNPSSFMQTAMAANISSAESVGIVINDAYADSRDVSWLWDISLESFKSAAELYTAGSRGADMAVRCKYDEIPITKVFNSLQLVVKDLSKKPGDNIIFCTYTAMLELRRILVKQGYTKQVL